MNKPREFWIQAKKPIENPMPSNRIVADKKEHVDSYNYFVEHVIEKSAYDKAIAALKRAKDLKYYVYTDKHGQEQVPYYEAIEEALKELGEL